LLVYYKYAAFIIGSLIAPLSPGSFTNPALQTLILPLGISFFTFQAIAYLVDVYRDEITPQRNLPKFALFMSLFPKITAGPIIRYQEVCNDIDHRKFDPELCLQGFKRFVIGMGKKVLIADILAQTANRIFATPIHELNSTVAWLGLVCYTLQIYFDFAGYTDMAIGLGRIFGFKIQENFNYPYIAKSLTEFWRRWHISLSTWFRDYLFIPLSYILTTEHIRKKIVQGEYKTNYRVLFSIMVVFTLCGLWHGAGWNFVIWGMLHGTVLCLENLRLTKIMKKWWPPLQHCYLMFIVMMAWVFFRMPTFSDAVGFFKALYGFSSGSGFQVTLPMYMNSALALALAAGIVLSMPTGKVISDFFTRHECNRLRILCESAGIICIVILSFASMAGSTFNPFLYQKF